ncbi:hypothetical protein THAOC_33112, partial [Thalassiosira oceanica]
MLMRPYSIAVLPAILLATLPPGTTSSFFSSPNKLFDRLVNDEAPESERILRLQKVVLVYRRFGGYDLPWVEAHLEDPVTRLPTPDMVEFANDGVEDDMGYATLLWNVEGIPDSRYLVKVMSNCTALENSHSTHNYFSTDDVEVVLDKTPPALYGYPLIHLSGSVDSVKREEYRFIFTEPLYCEEPHVFQLAVTLSIGQNSRIFTHGSHGSGIKTICEGREIRYRFDTIELEEWYAAQTTSSESTNLVIDVNIVLGGVPDLALNRADDFTFSSSWAQHTESPTMSPSPRPTNSPFRSSASNDSSDPSRTGNGSSDPSPTEGQPVSVQCVATQFPERLHLGCDGVDNDCDGDIDECDEDQFPPEISFEDGLAVDASKDADGLVTINTPTFRSLIDAQSYLTSILVAEDDCMGDLQLSITPPNLGASCQSTIFEVTATGSNCPDQTVTRRYQMTVDTDEPVVMVEFNLGQGHVNDFSSVGDEGVYLGIFNVEATDLAGNAGSATAYVVIVPEAEDLSASRDSAGALDLNYFT